ncbi:MAG TPA: lysophospholipid acyltransferase family protein [Acidisphaera sp.]|nr:lysophospholipid acyltransferase family protein [Acidisphaera sp.]
MEWRFKPARDFGLPLWRRVRSLGREPGLGSRVLHQAWLTSIGLYLWAFHRLHVDGCDNIPAEPPFVMIANHASYLDAFCLARALPRRLASCAYALAAGDAFFDTLPAAGFSAFAVNALPVWRKGAPAAELPVLRARLEEDRVVLILFPEGTRSRTGTMAHFRAGMGALVAGGPVPVVPCWIDGAHAAWPPERRLPRPRPISVAIGVPLTFAEVDNDRTGWSLVAERCEQAVRGLGLAQAGAAS